MSNRPAPVAAAPVLLDEGGVALGVHTYPSSVPVPPVVEGDPQARGAGTDGGPTTPSPSQNADDYWLRRTLLENPTVRALLNNVNVYVNGGPEHEKELRTGILVVSHSRPNY